MDSVGQSLCMPCLSKTLIRGGQGLSFTAEQASLLDSEGCAPWPGCDLHARVIDFVEEIEVLLSNFVGIIVFALVGNPLCVFDMNHGWPATYLAKIILVNRSRECDVPDCILAGDRT